MTLDDLKKLSDAELNMIVAKGLGWTKMNNVPGSGIWGYTPGPNSIGAKVPNFCGDMSAAWALVEGKKFCSVILMQVEDAYSCDIRPAPCKKEVNADAPKAQRAIVMAVLLAMGEGK